MDSENCYCCGKRKEMADDFWCEHAKWYICYDVLTLCHGCYGEVKREQYLFLANRVKNRKTIEALAALTEIRIVGISDAEAEDRPACRS
jgi:hypothetical protein